jgi:hypothetical protein
MRKRLGLSNTLGFITGLLGIAAVAKELRKPGPERTWHGRILGVPYDFRPPTMRRVLDSFWQPHNRSLLLPHAFGVGWSINLGLPVYLLRSRHTTARAS